jgi:hypothetical protein
MRVDIGDCVFDLEKSIDVGIQLEQDIFSELVMVERNMC